MIKCISCIIINVFYKFKLSRYFIVLKKSYYTLFRVLRLLEFIRGFKFYTRDINNVSDSRYYLVNNFLLHGFYTCSSITLWFFTCFPTACYFYEKNKVC